MNLTAVNMPVKPAPALKDDVHAIDIDGGLEKVRDASAVGRVAFANVSQDNMERIRKVAWDKNIPVRAMVSDRDALNTPSRFRMVRSATWF